MDNTVLVAVISFLGTVIGSAGGLIASAKLTQYRLEQLEKKVEAQAKAAADIPVLEERITNINRRVYSLEKRHSAGYSCMDSGQ